MIAERRFKLVRLKPTEMVRTLVAVAGLRLDGCSLIVSARGVPIEKKLMGFKPAPQGVPNTNLCRSVTLCFVTLCIARRNHHHE